MTTYRGKPVEYATYDRNADTYSLIGTDDECIAELSAVAFLSIPNRSNLEVRNGRYRSAGSKDKRSANRKSRDPWAAAAAAYLGPGAIYPITSAQQGSSPGLTAAILDQQMAAMRNIMAMPSRHMSPSQIMHLIDEVKKPAIKRDGIVAGEIVGYRCWRIEKGLLRSVYQSDVWKPGEVLEGRELGDWDQRGIHAWKDSGSKHYHDYIRSYLNRENDPFTRYFMWGDDNEKPETRPAMVTGTVFLWGDVVEHERGYRAEFARVRSLDWLYPDATMMGREQATLDALRTLYALTPPDGGA